MKIKNMLLAMGLSVSMLMSPVSIQAGGYCEHTNAYMDEYVYPTCEERGYYDIYCPDCGWNQYYWTSPYGHNYSPYEVTMDATCNTNGYSIRVCYECGNEETLIIPATGNHYFTSYGQTVAPTCTAEGYTVANCITCGKEVHTKVVPAAGHKMGEWESIRKSTDSSTGLKKRTCSVCNEVEEADTYSHGTIRKGKKKGKLQVFVLQALLAKYGYLNGTVDGSFGNQTEEAVKAFQKDQEFEESGIAFPQTVNALMMKYAEEMQAQNLTEAELIDGIMAEFIEELPADAKTANRYKATSSGMKFEKGEETYIWKLKYPKEENGEEVEEAEGEEDSEEGEAPTEPEVTEVPAEPEVTEAPAEPKVTEAPAEPKVTEAPAEPEVTEAPAEPEVTEAPAEPKADETPAEPAAEGAGAFAGCWIGSLEDTAIELEIKEDGSYSMLLSDAEGEERSTGDWVMDGSKLILDPDTDLEEACELKGDVLVVEGQLELTRKENTAGEFAGIWVGNLEDTAIELEIKEDGTYSMLLSDAEGEETSTGNWVMKESKLVLDPETEMEESCELDADALIVEGQLVLTRKAEEQDAGMEPKADATEEDYVGTWESTRVELQGMSEETKKEEHYLTVENKDGKMTFEHIFMGEEKYELVTEFKDGMYEVTSVPENDYQKPYKWKIQLLENGTLKVTGSLLKMEMSYYCEKVAE